MNDRMFKSKLQRWLRFIVGGVVNTAFTYGMYLMLNSLLGYNFAYLIAYGMGVVFAYWFNSVVVFRVPLTWNGLFSYPLVYVVQYVVSALLLGFLVENIGVGESFAPLMVTIGMVPVTYVMTGLLLGWTNRSKVGWGSDCGK